MMYTISELQQLYDQWISGQTSRKDKFAVSFYGSNHHQPYIFCGLNSLKMYIGKKIFQDKEIAYIHSLQKEGGKLIFCDGFIKFLSELTFDLKIESLSEGSLFFQGQPILKVEGLKCILSFFKGVISYYLPREIFIATEIEKIASFIAPVPVIVQNSFRSLESEGEIDVRSAYIGGAAVTEDLSAAIKFNIPICSHTQTDHSVIDISKTNLVCAISKLGENEPFMISSVLKKDDIEEVMCSMKSFKGAIVDLSKMKTEGLKVRYHQYRHGEILDPDFNIYRFSYKGLYVGDLIAAELELDERKTIFGKYVSLLRKEEIMCDIDDVYEESLDDQKRRVLTNFRRLPCKYRNGESKESYPIRILKKCQPQENSESLSNTMLA
jgi:hypothetical protein